MVFTSLRLAAATCSEAIFVVDRDAFDGNGGVIRVDSATGTQTTVSSGGSFVDPSGIVVDSSGHLIVAEPDGFGFSLGQGRLIRVDPATGAQTIISSGGFFGDPVAVVIDANGDLIVADAETGAIGGTGLILRVDPVTGAQTRLTLFAPSRLLWDPYGIALNAAGEIFVANVRTGLVVSDSSSVVKVDPITGAQSRVSSGGSLTCAYDLVVEPAGTVVVADGCTGLVRVVPSTGAQSVIAGAPQLRDLTGVTLDSSANLIAVSRIPSIGLVRVDPTTGQITTISSGGSFASADGVAVAPCPPTPTLQTPTSTPTMSPASIPTPSVTATPPKTPTPSRTRTATPSSTRTPTSTRSPTKVSKRPLIFIPGIYGSQLHDGTASYWPTTDECRLADLRPDSRGHSSTALSAQVLRRAFNTVDVYGDFLDRLRVLTSSSHDVVEFPYDWRLDIGQNARQLGTLISELLKASGFDRVDVIGHSMGGLVAKALLSQSLINERFVRRMIFVGTPHFGAPKATIGITDGVNDFRFGMLGLHPRTIAYVARNSPAAYQLLPTERLTAFGPVLSYLAPSLFLGKPGEDPIYGYQDFLDVLEQHRWKHRPCDSEVLPGECSCGSSTEGMNARLRDWVALHRRIDTWSPTNAGLDAFLIYGISRPNFANTIARVILSPRDGSVFDVVNTFGDDTVPKRSARAEGTRYFDGRDGQPRRFEFKADHLGLVQEDTVQACIVDLLRAVPTCNGSIIANSPGGLGADGTDTPRSLSSSIAAVFATRPNGSATITELQVKLEGEAAWLSLEDSEGNITGIGVDGIARNAVPGSQFDWLGSLQIAMAPASEGIRANIHASEPGTVVLRALAIGDEGPSFELQYDLELAASGNATVALHDPASLPSADVDADGDAIYESRAAPVEFPVANAGEDRTVGEGTLVKLDAALSASREGGPLTYRWAQVGGPSVDLQKPESPNPQFLAPFVSEATPLGFALEVAASDAFSRLALVNVTVEPCGPETCNGRDDNCDGLIDEQDPDLGERCVTGLGDPCSPGILVCSSGALACVPESSECEANGCTSDADCEDGIFCNGHEVCIDGLLCAPGEAPCDKPCELCEEKLGVCRIIETCGTPSPTPIPAEPTPTGHAPICTGDCDSNGEVTIDELTLGVSIALGNMSPGICPPFDGNNDETVTIDELVGPVSNALSGCP